MSDQLLFQSWYQDEFGVLMCQEEPEEEFYSDDELTQHEAALRRELTESSSKPAKAVELNKSVIDIERSKPSDTKPDTKLDTAPASSSLPAKPVEEAPAAPESQAKPPSKPAEVAEKPPVKEPPRSLVSGNTPRERWVWAYTKILQVREMRNCRVLEI